MNNDAKRLRQRRLSLGHDPDISIVMASGRTEHYGYGCGSRDGAIAVYAARHLRQRTRIALAIKSTRTSCDGFTSFQKPWPPGQYTFNWF
jgi:hypothetical protein